MPINRRIVSRRTADGAVLPMPDFGAITAFQNITATQAAQQRLRESMQMNSLDEAYSNQLAREREEEKKIAALPIKVIMTKEVIDGVTRYRVSVYRGIDVIDDMVETRQERAIQLYEAMLREYESAARNNRARYATGKTKDLRGEIVARNLQLRSRIGRIDRRGRRPEDDIITEDGLTIDIKVDDDVPAAREKTLTDTLREVWDGDHGLTDDEFLFT